MDGIPRRAGVVDAVAMPAALGARRGFAEGSRQPTRIGDTSVRNGGIRRGTAGGGWMDVRGEFI